MKREEEGRDLEATGGVSGDKAIAKMEELPMGKCRAHRSTDRLAGGNVVLVTQPE